VAASTRKRAGPGAARTEADGVLKKFRSLGLHADWDFLLHLPLRFLDETRVTPIARILPGQWVQIEAVIRHAEQTVRGRRQLRVRVDDSTGTVSLRWLNYYGSQVARFVPDQRVRVMGIPRMGSLGVEFVQPQVKLVADDTPLPQSLTPVYPTTQGLSQTSLRRRVVRALAEADWYDPVPLPVRRQWGLIDLRTALHALHEPTPGLNAVELEQAQAPARRRLQIDELLAQQLALRQARQRRNQQGATPLPRVPHAQVDALLAGLPFVLTGDQQRAWAEIDADLQQPIPMNRLLQGDVGSGKTIVAALASLRALEHGHQAAFMAPTEILATQHLERLQQWTAPLGIELVWLGGKLRESEKKRALERLASPQPCIAVGTHALIQDSVVFHSLAVAIVDEQHRFGVAQRLALRRGDLTPHLLMLSATPIPRSLAMTYLSDLDVSAIRERPPGRQPIRTKLISASRRDELLQAVRGEAAQGRQAYWVCPLVEDSEETELNAAVRMAETTRQQLSDLRVGLLHGQMSVADKRAAMQAFVEHRTDVLIATTIVEVGVDVPNATLMIIDHAERFGLASLHQLRGRVGRGSEASVCVLLYDEPLSGLARERLKILYESQDGFEIAQKDLQLRGPGEFLGARQWGVPLLRFADLEREAHWIDDVRALADRLLHDDPRGANHLIARWFGKASAYLEA
jgi:ATP-dependent DNA helicase RecG